MKRALLPIALFALLTYCLPLVSLLVPVLADGSFDQSAPAASGAEEEGRSPAAGGTNGLLAGARPSTGRGGSKE